MKLSISSSTDEEAGIEVKICGEGQGGAAAGASGVQGQGKLRNDMSYAYVAKVFSRHHTSYSAT